MRVRLLTLVIVTILGQQSANAQNTLKLKDGFVNEEYTTFKFADAVKGEGSGAHWSIATGALPGGLILLPNGDLSGTPTTVGMYSFEVKADVGGIETFRTTVILRIRPAGFDTETVDAAGASATSVLPASFTPPVCTPTPSTFVLASSTADEETIALTEDASNATLATLNANTLQILDADTLIRTTLGNAPSGTTSPIFQKGDYTVIHLVKWKVVKTDADKTDPDKELWALYEYADRGTGRGLGWVARMDPDNKENFDSRIFGSHRVAVLLLHLQTPRTWDVKYKVNINRRVPQPIQNVLKLAGFIGGGGPQAECEPSPTRNIWGGRLMLDKHLASDVVVKLNTVTAGPSGEQISQSKEYSKSYLNEGRYHWDVSVGMPVKSIKELEFSSENGVVTAKKKERQNAYGFLNLFPRAVDLNGKSYLTSFHFVLGVPISGKPLDRPVVGVGTGLYTEQFKVNFFAGVAFNRVREPRTLAAGQAATEGQLESDLQTRRVKKFVFGINFPVKQFIDAVKGSSK